MAGFRCRGGNTAGAGVWGEDHAAEAMDRGAEKFVAKLPEQFLFLGHIQDKNVDQAS
jgi:hypothetical protein